MAAERHASIYTNTLLWGFVLLATAGVVLVSGLWAGLAVFASAAVGVLVLSGLVALYDRLGGEPQYENKLDPWDD
jgi:hypothetical protein